MDGYTAFMKLSEANCQAPVVALTASAMKEDRERCLKAGCKDYLSKPIQKYQLYQTLKKNIEDTKSISGVLDRVPSITSL